ncbi:MAG: ABC transporter ATP-binding protein, partial [Deltaproteobacteria bacterium]|nr:ABC transporter ATP-binding protein [Deltaproteobacteria bacterium]
MGNNEIVVRAERVSKKFCKRLKRSLWYGVQDVTSTLLWGNKNHGGLRKDEFWAVNDISFEVKKGETLGMIGPNGSGKTTLLKMINGIFRPDRGTVTVEGKVGALIAVGAGFHPMLTGRENIYINGAILGMSKKEIDKQYDDIIEFADIGDFLDMPVNNYSSGMFVRLGFAVAVHSGPDILLVDEVLAVGDINFQSRCLNKIGKMRGKGVTTIIVSHRMPIISGFCQEVVYLNHGRVRSRG